MMVSVAERMPRYIEVFVGRGYTFPHTKGQDQLSCLGVTSTSFLLNVTMNHMKKYRGTDSIFVNKLLCSIYVDNVVFRAERNESAYMNCIRTLKCDF